MLIYGPFLHGKEKKLAVDEERFAERRFDFSPPEERALDERWLKAPDEPYPFPRAEVAEKNGVKTIIVDGEPFPTWSRAVRSTTLPGAPVERQMREQGVKLFLVEAMLTSNKASKGGEITLADGASVSFAQFSQRMEALLASVPDARVMVRLWMMNVGRDFVEAHPDSLLQGPDGKTEWAAGYHTDAHTARPNLLNAWRRYCGEHLYRFIHRVGASPYARRVVGFHIAAANTGEWWYYKGKDDPGWDYSETRKEAFVRLLRHKYGESAQAVADAWGVPPGESLWELPGLEERQQRPILPNTRNADYLQVLNLPVTNAAEYFARIIKVATGGRSLVGMQIHTAFVTAPGNGTVFARRLLESPDIDILGGASNYAGRRAGEVSLFRLAAASMDDHGKLWWNEGDYRTHMAHGTVAGAVGEAPTSAEEMRQVFRREFARGLAFDYSTYLMDFGWDWFYEPSIFEDVGELVRADEFARMVGVRRGSAEIAVVTDQESQLYANYYANPTRMLGGLFDRMGAAWDFYELRDFLSKESITRYRLVIFLNLRALGDGERASLERVKSDGRVVIWMHDPGMIDLSARSRDPEAQLKALTGLRLRLGSEPKSIRLLPAAAALFTRPAESGALAEDSPQRTQMNRNVSLSDGAAGLPMGNVASRIYGDDPDAIPLAVDRAGRPFFLMRTFPEWTSVFTAFCELRPAMLRAFAKKAGCHLFLDTDDVTFATGNFVGIHASTSGEKLIRFSRPTGFYDVFADRVVKREAKELRLPMQRGETRLFYLGDAHEAQAVAASIRKKQGEARSRFTARYPAPSVAGAPILKNFAFQAPGEGALPLKGYMPSTLFVAGPFSNEAAEVEALDAIARDASVAAWQPADFRSRIGRNADDFMRVVRPESLRRVENGLAPWTACTVFTPWINEYHLGMATGQSYVVAFQLMAQAQLEALLYYATEGDARLWVDGKEIARGSSLSGESGISLSPSGRWIVLRMRGGERPSGFTLKVAAPQRGQLAGKADKGNGATLTVHANPDALVAVQAGIEEWIPPLIKHGQSGKEE